MLLHQLPKISAVVYTFNPAIRKKCTSFRHFWDDISSIPRTLFAFRSNIVDNANSAGQMRTIKIVKCNFEFVENFSCLGLKIITDNSYDNEIRAPTLIKIFPLEISPYRVKAFTVSSNDLASPQYCPESWFA